MSQPTPDQSVRRCPGCGKPFDAVRPSQTHCRPSCKARQQLADAQRERRLPFDDLAARLVYTPFEE